MINTVKLIAEQLDRHAIAIVDDILPEFVLKELLSDARQLLNEGDFEPAHVGRGVAVQRIKEVRGDKIKWLEKENLTSAQTEYFIFLEQLREHLSNYFRISLPWFECHLATYPVGSFYTRHIDQFRETNNRIFSVILYLNVDWKAEDGGQLRVYEGDEFVDIQPIIGRLVCFRSDLVPHEVLTTNRTRFSITGWLRRDEPTPVFL
ncbi:MAG: 2OG-Fe(II) oxygenase [Flavobacteriales bacterium]|nr:2OG-Fe(II) oxygenase [Flavobacteriales bacterium]